jgi:hypothetical protein
MKTRTRARLQARRIRLLAAVERIDHDLSFDAHRDIERRARAIVGLDPDGAPRAASVLSVVKWGIDASISEQEVRRLRRRRSVVVFGRRLYFGRRPDFDPLDHVAVLIDFPDLDFSEDES